MGHFRHRFVPKQNQSDVDVSSHPEGNGKEETSHREAPTRESQRRGPAAECI